MGSNVMQARGVCGRLSPTSDFCAVCDIRESSICAELTDEEMKAVSVTMAHIAVKEDQAIIEEGETSEFLCVVVSGSFRMVRILADGRRQITGFVFAGDYLGMNKSTPNDYTAEALEPSLVCRFAHGYLDEMSVRHPGIKDRLIARGQTDLHKAQDHIVLLGKASAEERVMSFLKMVAPKTEERPGADRFYLPMSRQDIADYLGLRMETLSRTLSKL
ncbi:MAG: cyclic nucleotide-binding domain-containing protein, partial [Pseudomonadota bacterium]